jgi:hypothetical protein
MAEFISEAGRYDNIPITEQTRKGMSLNIDDLGAISRLLMLQDDVYEERFTKLEQLLDRQNQLISTQVLLTEGLVEEVKSLKTVVQSLEIRINDIANRLESTNNEVEVLKKQVEWLKIMNSWWALVIRIGIAVATAFFLHKYFWR